MTRSTDRNEDGEKVGKRRRRSRRDLDAIFGDVLPDVTNDEPKVKERDEDLRREVPPHHG